MESPREMINRGNYLVPYFKDEIRVNKPILFYWIVISSYKIFGESVVGARIPSIFFAFLGCFVLFKFYLLLFKDKKGAFYSLTVLLSSFHYLYHARMATLDMSLTVFILISIYYAVKGLLSGNTDKNFFISALFVGFAVMTKGPIGLIIPYLSIAVFIILLGKKEKLKSLFRLRNSITVLLLGAGWYTLLVLNLGWREFEHVLLVEARRMNISKLNILKNFMRNIVNFFRIMFPWPLFLIPVLLKAGEMKNLISGREKVISLLLTWILLVFSLVLFVFPYHPRYLLPAVPPCAMLIGYFIIKLEEGLDSESFRKIYSIFTYSFVGAAAVFFIIYLLILIILPQVAPYIGGLFFLWGIGALVLYWNKNRQNFETLLAVTAVLFLVSYSVILGNVATFFKRNPFNNMAKTQLINLNDADSLITIGPDKKSRSWLVFLGKHFIDEFFDERDSDDLLLAKEYLENPELYSSKAVYVILSAQFFETISEKSRFDIVCCDYKFYGKARGRIGWRELYYRLLDVGLSGVVESFKKEYFLVKYTPEGIRI